MHIVKMIAMILLAAFLILNGLAGMSEITLAPQAMTSLGVIGLAAGVLILISIGRFVGNKKR